MTGRIDNGLAHLALTATELRALFVAVNREAIYQQAEAERCEAQAASLEELAKTTRRKREAARLAGTLRTEASVHRAFYREACDLRRVIARLTMDTDVH